MSEVASTASCQVRSHFISPPAEFDGCFTTFYRLELDIADGATVWDHLQPEWANIRFFAGGCPISQLPGGPALSGARFTATGPSRSEEHTSELQSLMRISYAVFCLKKKNNK